ncbi:serine/threonine-protein kinase [Actinomadura fulvescens]|uniref:Protein kinase domain-containing protein n=1 Tax=Actinomadura fulvescens TaxID=46160 RepID=A0ABP6C9M0_9ACTN
MQPPAPPAPPAAALAPLRAGDPPLVGGYRVLARIGAGRVGRVYLATTQSGRRLAIKVARPEFAGDPEFRRRFQDEVRAVQRVAHRFVAAVVDTHPDGPQRPWVATEFVPGPSLARALAEHGPLPTDTVRALVAGLAEGLRALHDAGVVHGDLKPSNVLLGAAGPTIVDCGIARAAAAVQATGSPLFMAPEQARPHDVTPAADVFALGHLAFHAATGRTAFGTAADEIMVAPVAYDRPDLTGCPSVLRGLVQRCLAPSPGDRPSLDAVLAELEQDPPGEGWLPAAVAARLPLYEADPPKPAPPPLASSAPAMPQILPPVEIPVAHGTPVQAPPVTAGRDSTAMLILMAVLVAVGAVCSFVLVAILL